MKKQQFLPSTFTNQTLQNSVSQYPFNTNSTRNSITSIYIKVWAGQWWCFLGILQSIGIRVLLITSFHQLWKGKKALPWPQNWPQTADIIKPRASLLQPVHLGNHEGIPSNMKSHLKHLAGKHSSYANMRGSPKQMIRYVRTLSAKVNFSSTVLWNSRDRKDPLGTFTEPIQCSQENFECQHLNFPLSLPTTATHS